MNEILILLVVTFLMNYINFYVLSNLMFLMSLYFLKNISWIKWINIFMGLSNNNYSNYLILMMIWVFGMIFLNLNEMKKSCLMLNLILFFFNIIEFYSYSFINILFYMWI